MHSGLCKGARHQEVRGAHVEARPQVDNDPRNIAAADERFAERIIEVGGDPTFRPDAGGH
eukprot:1570258-Alexandrium_andersonii.AAC.1